MTKSALINALDKRNAKLSASSNGGDQAVDEAFESLFGTKRAARLKFRLNSCIRFSRPILVLNHTVGKI